MQKKTVEDPYDRWTVYVLVQGKLSGVEHTRFEPFQELHGLICSHVASLCILDVFYSLENIY
jgi:hypothetical protein